jgi:A/G-specific adenine glycosylase
MDSQMTPASTPPTLDSQWKQNFRRRLLAWYARHQRDLPWRRSADPYRVWLSEVMLQQTQVETVKPYFARFVRAFPTVEKLAAAEESEVLRLWEGLGYYRRARSLHAAAKRIVSEFGGQFPHDVKALQTLPGIGRYTAGAIASIAFNERVPILEANTVRLLARLMAYRDDPTKTAGQALLWATAEELLPQKRTSMFNQALMELGALVCVPGKPDCERCPVTAHCGAFRAGLQNELPCPTRKQQFLAVREAAVVIRKNGRVLLRQCQPNERWAGLWDFVRFEIAGETQLAVHHELQAKTRDLTGLVIELGPLVATIKHGVTRYRITLECYTARHVAGRINSRQTHLRWVRPGELGDYPLSTTGRKLANKICQTAVQTHHH